MHGTVWSIDDIFIRTVRKCLLAPIYSRFTKNRGRFWSKFRGKNRPIYKAKFSFLLLGGLLDPGSRPSVVNELYLFPIQCSVFQIIDFLCKPTVFIWIKPPKEPTDLLNLISFTRTSVVLVVISTGRVALFIISQGVKSLN